MTIQYKTVRVFISSTFKDMHSERDYLVKNVFPELRERCALRGLELIDVDLRWGVTEEEAQSGKALEICLEEIEKSRPFFIGLIGERYGWIPAPQEIPAPRFYQLLKKVNPDEKAFLLKLFEKDSRADGYLIKDKRTPEDDNRIIGIMEKYDFQPFDIPGGVKNEDVPSYEWIRQLKAGHSVTAMEIYHGVLNNPQMKHRAYFYFRNPAFIKDVPKDKQAEVLAESVDAKRKLEALKHTILNVYKDIPKNVSKAKDGKGYPCQYAGLAINWLEAKSDLRKSINEQDLRKLEAIAADGIVDNTEYAKLNPKQKRIINKYGRVRLSGLKAFGEEVQNNLWQAIENQYPEMRELKDPLDSQIEAQRWFAESRLKFFVGRQDILDKLQRYREGKENRPIFIFGQAGTGKSAIMAKMAKESGNDGWWVFENYAGSTALSGNLMNTLERLMNTLCRDFGLKRVDDGNIEVLKSDKKVEDIETLKAEIQMLLSQAGRQKKIIIVFDALNQFSNSALESEKLQWLPSRLPENVKWTISAISGEIENTVRIKGLGSINVAGIAPSYSKMIVEETLGEYRKKLSDEQMKHLLKKRDSDKPLYLKIACEELRIYPRFELLTQRIQQMNGNAPILIEEVLERLEQDNGETLVRDTFSLIGCSRDGLLENELLELLAKDKEVAIPQAVWGKLYRGIRELVSGGGSEGLNRFYHQQMELAVAKRYLKTEDIRKGYHRKLGDYAYHKFLIEARKKHVKNIRLINTRLDCGGYLFNSEDKDSFLDWAKNTLNATKTKREALILSMDAQINWMVQGNDKNELERWNRYFAEIKGEIISIENGLYFHLKGQNLAGTVFYQWAISFYQLAIGIIKPLYEQNSDNLYIATGLACSYVNMGSLSAEINKTEDAVQYYELAISILKTLYEKNPDNLDIANTLTTNYDHLGSLLSRINKKEVAGMYYDLAMGITKPLYEQTPDNFDIANSLAYNYIYKGSLLDDINKKDDAVQYYKLAIGIIKPLYEQAPDNLDIAYSLARTYNYMGLLLADINQKKEAVRYYKLVIKITKSLYEKNMDSLKVASSLASIYGNMGTLLSDINKKDDSMRYYKLASGIIKKLHKQVPDNLDIANGLAYNYINLGSLLAGINRKEDAVRYYELAIGILRHLYLETPDNLEVAEGLATLYNNYGSLLADIKKREEAVRYYKLAIKITKPLYKRSPDNLNIANGLANTYGNLGFLLDEIGCKKETARYYKLAVEIRKPIYKKTPDNLDIAHGLAATYDHIGLLLDSINEKEEAVRYYELAIGILKPIYEKTPDNQKIANGLTMTYSNLCSLLVNINQKEEAMRYNKLAIGILKNLYEKNPDNLDIANGLAIIYDNMGFLLEKIGRKKNALRYYKLSIRIREPLYEKNPDNLEIADGLAVNYFNYGKRLSQSGNKNHAVVMIRKAEIIARKTGLQNWRRL